MTKFVGQVAGQPERRDGRWYFSVWNAEANHGINCISSTRFKMENQSVPLAIKPLDEVEVIGEVRLPGTCFFDYLKVRRKAERAEVH